MNHQSIADQLERDEHGVGVVLAAIPFGSENAIKRRDLCARLGMNDRQVRKLIELARAEGHIIVNNQSGAGYFQSNDLDEIERQYWQDTARAMTILRRRKELRRRLREAGRPV